MLGSMNVVLKSGQRTGTKNAVLTLFTCVAFVLSWGCSGKTDGPCIQYLGPASDGFLRPQNRHQPSTSTIGWLCVPDGWQPRLPKQVMYSKLPNPPRLTGRRNQGFRDVFPKRDLNALCLTDTSWDKPAYNKREWKSATETGKQTSKKSLLEDFEGQQTYRCTRRDRLWLIDYEQATSVCQFCFDLNNFKQKQLVWCRSDWCFNTKPSLHSSFFFLVLPKLPPCIVALLQQDCTSFQCVTVPGRARWRNYHIWHCNLSGKSGSLAS